MLKKKDFGKKELILTNLTSYNGLESLELVELAEFPACSTDTCLSLT